MTGRPGPGWRPQLLALDIDGTILDHDQKLSDRVREAVRAVADAGFHVVIATGRSLHSTLPVLDRLGLLEGWAVCSNGSVTLRLDPGLSRGYEVSDTVTFDPREVLTLLREHLPTALYALENGHGEFLLTAPFPEGELTAPEIRVAEDFEELMSQPACRIVVRSPDHTSDDFLRLTERIGLHGVSKASGLEQVRHRLGVLADATLAVGDGRNDLEMFAWARLAVAMGNAVEDVRAAADDVALPVQDDGLADVLESLLPRG